MEHLSGYNFLCTCVRWCLSGSSLLACSAPTCEAGAACDEKRKPGSCFRLDEAIRARTAAWTQAETEGQAEGDTKRQTGTDRGTDGGPHRGVQDEWMRNLKTELATG